MRTTRYKVYPKQMNRLKRVAKLYPLKSQLMSPENSQTECASHLILKTELWFFHVNGKYPQFSGCPADFSECSMVSGVSELRTCPYKC